MPAPAPAPVIRPERPEKPAAMTEEIDAMRTIGIEPIDLLVLPKIIALVAALPLLTVFSDVTGVLGGMVMARSQLDIGFNEFLIRFGSQVAKIQIV